MHGHSLVSALLVNAEVDSMGGVVDCGVGVDSKASPLRVAIEKVQAELRQEYDVREERRRELEFLENGGNPLDFKVGHIASVSVQSTSLSDRLADQYGISEAKGSFALAPSPHGDSVESSGRLGGSLGREPNIADNLLLFDGEHSNVGGERKVKRTGKRSNATPLEKTAQVDGCHNAKESEDSGIFRIGFKSQAYARRNRSRSSRENSHVSPTDLIPGQCKSSVLPHLRPDSKDAKGIMFGTQPEDHAISSIYNSKPASPNDNVASKASASDDQIDMELDAVQTQCSNRTERGVLEEVKSSENMQENDHDNQLSQVVPVNVPNGIASQSSDFIGKGEFGSDGCGSAPGSGESTKIANVEKAIEFDVPGKDVTDLHDDHSMEICVVDPRSEALNMNNTMVEPSCVNSSIIDGNAYGDQSSMLRKIDGNLHGDSKEPSAIQGILSLPDNNDSSKKFQLIAADTQLNAHVEPGSVHSNLIKSSNHIKDEVELCGSQIDLQSEGRPPSNPQSIKPSDEAIAKTERVHENSSIAKTERVQENSFGDSIHSINKDGITTSTLVVPRSGTVNAILSKRGSAATTDLQDSTVNHLKLARKAHEDSILKEARVIEANSRRAGELSIYTSSLEKRKKCHWDFVLEEMAWMANDFMQERVWKTTAAAHVCQWISSSGRFMFEQENIRRKQRKIARSLAKAVMHFWHSAEAFRSSVKIQNGAQNSGSLGTLKFNGGDSRMDKDSTYDKAEKSTVISRPAIQGYAVRFLNYMSNMSIIPILPEAPTTPERISDRGILEMSREEQLSGASLYYTVAPGAMQAYRESVESLWGNAKNIGNTIHEEDCEGSMCDSVADGHRENAYEEDEAETGSYFLNGGYERSLSHKFNHKKKKNLQRQSYAARSYEGGDFPYEHYVDGKSASQPLTFNGKRPPTGINVGLVPTKRVRTAARQRVISPFGAGVAGSLQLTCKTDVSSGDTSSFQDDQSSLHGGSQSRRNFEVESTADFERQLPYDDSEISSKSKKKKKPKHLGYKNSLNLTDSGVLVVSGKGSLYEQRLKADSMVQHDQRDHVKKRSESQHFDVNVGSYARHASKRPKFTKHLPETSSEAITPFSGSMPSPVASQMSNMSSPNKLFKLIANRDRRKNKGIKMAAGPPGSGSPWSSFEDQALVVLVHDMGTNWELISDAINSTLQFKRIFRKPNECKERHKIVMEKSCDGADSAEDSGSSQPYKSTLPGIPKGSALQLFQYLQGPVEEDTIKAHFEKIILIGQKLHVSRNQNDGQEVKQVTPAHNSHETALSQVCPNNLSGGILTPLDLCDAITSSSDALNLGYQGSNASGLPNHQSSVTPVHPATSSNTMLQGSPGGVLGNSLSSASTPLNGTARDVQRYGVPRPSSLPTDEQQRMQQYNPMFSGRNIQQPNISVPGPLPVGTERGVRMLPGGNGMGVMCGINRGMPMPRPGFQGMSNPGMLNLVSTGSMLSGSGVGMPNPVNVHPGAASSQGNSMMRPRSTLQMMRPGQNTEDHRQIMMQELQLQVSQGSGQTVAPFNGISAPFSNATVPPPVQTFPVQQHQQSHQKPQQPHMLGHHSNIQAANHPSTQHQAYAIRFAKERQLQQRIMPQQQHSFTGSASPVQNSSQVQQQAQPSSSANPISAAQLPHKQQQMPRNPQSGNGIQNPGMKQRQRQSIQHQPRPQQQQRQQAQHQAKLMKGLGRGTMFVHQNVSPDGSHVSGISTAPKNQLSEKHPLQQGQGFFSGNTALNPTLSQPLNQPKMFPHQLPQPSKQMPPVPSHSDNLNQAAVHISSSHTLLGSQQPPAPSLPLTTQQHQRQTNQSQQNMQRMTLQQNRPMNPDSRLQSSTEQVQVNQMITTTPIAQCTDSSPPIVASGTQWKPEPSYDTSAPTATVNMAGSPQESLVGNETLLPPSSQGLVQRQFSGNISMHKSGLGS